MATGKWPKNDQQKAPRSFSHFFTCFRLFSTVSALFRARFLTFWAVCFWLFLAVRFRTIRLLPCSGCHLDSPDSLSASQFTVKTRLRKTFRGNCQGKTKYGEKKTDKEKSHKGIWRSDAPEASQGQTRDVPGTPGTFGPDLCVTQY